MKEKKRLIPKRGKLVLADILFVIALIGAGIFELASRNNLSLLIYVLAIVIFIPLSLVVYYISIIADALAARGNAADDGAKK